MIMFNVSNCMLFGLCFQENIFEWQFAIRGPSDTEFEGGIYHGRIQLPAEYPFQPPSFMLLTVKYLPLENSIILTCFFFVLVCSYVILFIFLLIYCYLPIKKILYYLLIFRIVYGVWFGL